jgi:hypothetical protein
MARKKELGKEYRIDLLKKTEVKRVEEGLTIAEFASIYNISYQFYYSCLKKRSNPSESIEEAMIQTQFIRWSLD